MKHGIWVTSILMTLLTAATGTGAANGELGPNETLVFEPVFQGEVLIYESGKNHEESVVLVHGLGDNGARDWEQLIPELDGFHVIAFDLPGFGRSQKQNARYSPMAYAAFIKWVVDTHVEGGFTLVGHSLGGAVALRYASMFPRNLDQLILVDVAGVLYKVAISKHMVEEAAREYLPEPIAQRTTSLLRRITARAIDRLEEKPLDVGVATESAGSRNVFLGANPSAIASLELAEEDFSRLVDHVNVPTMVLWGADDTVTPLRTGLVMEARLPHAKLEVIPHAGHVVMRDQPEEFNNRVLAVLEGKWSPPPAREVAPEFQASTRTGTCEHEPKAAFKGHYDRINIVGCTGVRLIDVTARMLEVAQSEVEIVNSRFVGDDFGIIIRDSYLEATATTISGNTAVLVDNSGLDLAAVVLNGIEASISAESTSTLLASISEVSSPLATGTLHGYWKLAEGEKR